MLSHPVTPPASAAARGHALRTRREGGFALLITIVLVAFLVLILVGLAAFTRVETQVASNAQQQAQARQNALMALNIAVGQLQKYAGPDQRVTAPADLQNAPDQPNAHWTGVYGSAVEADYADTPESVAVALSNTANLNANGSPARLLNWLVSGNERTAFDPRRSTGDVGAKGNITGAPASTISFLPGATVTGLSATTEATDIGIRITDSSGTARDARLLVGVNSVTSALDASSRPIDYVAAPAVAIEAPASTVPGMNPAGPDVTIGRYAWWVGDEGVKARVNLPLAGTSDTLTDTQRQEQLRNAFSNSPRAAIELMAKDDNNDNWATIPPDQNHIDTLYTPSQSVADIVTIGQAPFSSSTPSALGSALKHRFHDVSALSTTVLSDTYAGGLKRDLSVLLDPSYSPAASDPTADLNRMWTPHAGDTGGFLGAGTGYAIPTWRHLRSFAQTRVPTTGVNALSFPVRLPANDKPNKTSTDPDDVGVAPVLTYFSTGFRAAPTAPPAANVPIHMNLYPLVVIWNPYNFTLKAPAPEADGSNFEVGILPTYEVRVGLEAQVAGVWTRRSSLNLQRTSTASSGNFIRFRLKCPDIPAGQSLIFSLPPSSSGDIYNQRNILENIEPESGSYVSIPFLDSGGAPLVIQTGEESINYRLYEVLDGGTGYNYSSSFRGGGGVHMYLGEPSNASAISTTGGANDAANRAMFNPSATNRRWYSTAQDIDWSGLVVINPNDNSFHGFQEQGPLVYDPDTSEAAYVFQCQALFTGQGSNAQLNANQYMFSTRWLAQGNMRAVRSGRTRRDNNYNVLFTATAGLPLYTFPWQKFFNGPGEASNRTSAGLGHDWINNAPVDVGLFEFPYEGQPLLSIGQLQHANLSLVGAYPAYPVGNSLMDFRLISGGTSFPSTPAGWQLARVDTGAGAQGLAKLGNDMRGYYDISYLLNRNLWDRYYFSTVPATGTIDPDVPLANPRHVRHVPHDTTVNLQNPDRSAAALLLAGGFNINSTSEQAWRAILGGGNQLNFDPENPDDEPDEGDILRATFSRFIRPGGDDDPNNAWEGYRSLDENEIAQLARNIVAQIRARGPFVSLADFVNRRLVDNSATATEDETYRGPIQAAIDATTTASAAQFPANDAANTFWSQDQLITSSGTRVNQTSQYDMGYYGRAQLEGRRNATTAAERPYGARAAFAPKYITQADVLAKIGSGLTARSDTFTIRTYGEAVNPATGDITARAWCEAVVQRLPEYVEDTVDPWTSPAGGSASQTFGRKFKITSFRWLSPSDI